MASLYRVRPACYTVQNLETYVAWLNIHPLSLRNGLLNSPEKRLDQRVDNTLGIITAPISNIETSESVDESYFPSLCVSQRCTLSQRFSQVEPMPRRDNNVKKTVDSLIMLSRTTCIVLYRVVITTECLSWNKDLIPKIAVDFVRRMLSMKESHGNIETLSTIEYRKELRPNKRCSA
jgi:hypothetical protein